MLTRTNPGSSLCKTEQVVLDLPPPLSVNKLRRIDWAVNKKKQKWIVQADQLFMMRKHELRNQMILGKYELHLVLDEARCGNDLDNNLKVVCDVLKRYGLVTDDSPKYLRKITIEFGEAPEGARVTLKPVE